LRFEVSEQVRTRANKWTVINALEMQFRKVSRKVDRRQETLTVRAIEASFGSINRYDLSVVQLQQKEGGYLCIADVTYRPSAFFWLFFVIGLFFYFLLWWPPIIFYLTQRKTVRSAIADVFVRVRNEFELDANAQASLRIPAKSCPVCGSSCDGLSHFCISCGNSLDGAAPRAALPLSKPQLSTVESLERLTALKDRGALSDSEFEAEKRKVLAQSFGAP
jgi:Short C-terminal domain